MLVDDLTLISSLGRGAFGEVYLTSKRGVQEKFATKKIDKKLVEKPRARKYFDNEVGILKEVNHKNIVKLIEVKETTNSYYLVCELCNGGGLSDCLEKYQSKYKRPFTEEMVQHLMRQIVDVIKYLHGKGILHRDLKLDNILVNFETEQDKKNLNMLKAQVKVIDFGFARHLQPGDLAKSTLGSPINMDPGILKKLNKMSNFMDYGYDEKADIWSLGTLCYEMLIGKCTFDAENMKELLQKIDSGNYYLPTTISKEAVSFLNGMLQYDLKRRLSAAQLASHHFLTKDYKNLTPINLTEAQRKIERGQLRINSKNNDSIWQIFDTDGPIVLKDIDSNEMIDHNIESENLAEKIARMKIEEPKPIIPIPSSQESLKDLKGEFLKAFNLMNSDFIYTEPKLIPIIPGNDPAVINPSSEFSEDNF